MEQVFALNGMYPINNESEIKLACSYFDKAWRCMCAKDRVIYSDNIVKQAVRLGTDIESPQITKYSKIGLKTPINKDIFKTAMQVRKEMCDDNPKNKAYIDAITKMALDDSQTYDSLLKVVDIIDTFDKYAGLDMYYDSDVPDPIASMYDCKEENTIDFGMRKMSAIKLCALRNDFESLNKIESIYGKTAKESFQRNPIKMVNDLNGIAKTAFYEKIIEK
jgi:hypothetical protein